MSDVKETGTDKTTNNSQNNFHTMLDLTQVISDFYKQRNMLLEGAHLHIRSIAPHEVSVDSEGNGKYMIYIDLDLNRQNGEGDSLRFLAETGSEKKGDAGEILSSNGASEKQISIDVSSKKITRNESLRKSRISLKVDKDSRSSLDSVVEGASSIRYLQRLPGEIELMNSEVIFGLKEYSGFLAKETSSTGNLFWPNVFVRQLVGDLAEFKTKTTVDLIYMQLMNANSNSIIFMTKKDYVTIEKEAKNNVDIKTFLNNFSEFKIARLRNNGANYTVNGLPRSFKGKKTHITFEAEGFYLMLTSSTEKCSESKIRKSNQSYAKMVEGVIEDGVGEKKTVQEEDKGIRYFDGISETVRLLRNEVKKTCSIRLPKVLGINEFFMYKSDVGQDLIIMPAQNLELLKSDEEKYFLLNRLSEYNRINYEPLSVGYGNLITVPVKLPRGTIVDIVGEGPFLDVRFPENMDSKKSRSKKDKSPGRKNIKRVNTGLNNARDYKSLQGSSGKSGVKNDGSLINEMLSNAEQHFRASSEVLPDDVGGGKTERVIPRVGAELILRNHDKISINYFCKFVTEFKLPGKGPLLFNVDSVVEVYKQGKLYFINVPESMFMGSKINGSWKEMDDLVEYCMFWNPKQDNVPDLVLVDKVYNAKRINSTKMSGFLYVAYESHQKKGVTRELNKSTLWFPESFHYSGKIHLIAHDEPIIKGKLLNV